MTYKERVASGCTTDIPGLTYGLRVCVYTTVVIDHCDVRISMYPDEAISLRNALLELFPVDKP